MKFNTAYSPAAAFAEPPCPKYIQKYKLNKAKHEIELCEKEPFYAKIQSYAESSSLSSVLSRVQLGDASALSSHSGQYIDVSGVPNNLAALHEVGKKSTEVFASLDSDIRKLFKDNQGLFSVCVANGTAEPIIRDYLKLKQSAGAGTGTEPKPGENE